MYSGKDVRKETGEWETKMKKKVGEGMEALTLYSTRGDRLPPPDKRHYFFAAN